MSLFFSSTVAPMLSPTKKEPVKGKPRKRLDGIFAASDDAALVAGILEYGHKWKKIWDNFEFNSCIEHKSLKDRARSKPFRLLLERARRSFDETVEKKNKEEINVKLDESGSIVRTLDRSQ
eukprot:6174613-Ditylum_brightwellii.AAC.1